MQTDAGSCWRLGQQLACVNMNVYLHRLGFDFLGFREYFSLEDHYYMPIKSNEETLTTKKYPIYIFDNLN